MTDTVTIQGKAQDKALSVYDFTDNYKDVIIEVRTKTNGQQVTLDRPGIEALRDALNDALAKLPKPKFVPLEVPDNGDYIVATLRSGKTVTGEVKCIDKGSSRYVAIDIQAQDDWHLVYINLQEETLETKYDILGWRKAERPIPARPTTYGLVGTGKGRVTGNEYLIYNGAVDGISQVNPETGDIRSNRDWVDLVTNYIHFTPKEA